MRPTFVLTFGMLTIGCAQNDRDRAWILARLDDRGFSTALEHEVTEPIQLESDALDQDDVIAVALASNPAYRGELARIDTARADLDEASRPANPQLTIAGGLGPISSLATLIVPLESLWQVPLRTRVASRNLESIAESLVQVGLDLVRDVRLAHVELVLAEDRLRIREELLGMVRELARISAALSTLGEASPAEAAATAAESSLAEDAVALARLDVLVARTRLLELLGVEATASLQVHYVGEPGPPPRVAELVALARRSRPDVLAAALALDAAVARVGWERGRVAALAANVDGHWTRPDVLALRLGGRVELPIFGANPGGIGRAEADVERSQALLEAVRVRVVGEIVRAHAQHDQAHASLTLYRARVLPELEEAVRVATRNYELGEDTYLVVIDPLRRLGEARLREAELVAQTRRAEAELERAVGARLGEPASSAHDGAS